MVELIAFFAGTLTTVSLLPQVIETWQTRSGAGLSMTMLIMFSSGVGLWMTYGIVAHILPIIIFNSITLGLGLALIVMKIAFR